MVRSAVQRKTIAGLLCFLAALILSLDFAPAQSQRFERLVKQLDYLDDRTLFEPAWETLRATLPAGARIFSIVIEGKRIAVEATAGAGKLDRWTVGRGRFLGFFERDLVGGPHPVRNPPAGFQAALFDLDDVAVGSLEGLIDRAIQRAGLDDPARVTRIDIGSPQIVLPSLHFGRLRITLTVGSGRESATVFATPDGTIVAADLSQTNRAERLDLLATDDWPMQEAQEALTKLAGADGVIRTVEVGRKRITLRQDNPTNPAAADFLSWDLSGALRNPIPTLNPARDGVSYLPFTLAEVDFTKLPQVKKNAIAAFKATGATITDITAKKTLSPAGYAASEVMWHVTAQFPNAPASRFGIFPEMDELGLATVRVDGTVHHVRLPKRLRPPIDWFGGEGMVLALGAVRDTFGDKARIREVRVDDDGAQIYMEDPTAPGKSITLAFDEDGLTFAFIQSTSMTRPENAFTLSQLDPIGIDGVAAIVKETYRRAGLTEAPEAHPFYGRDFRTTLYGSAGRKTPAGTPQLEIRANASSQVMTYRFATGEYVPDLEQW